MPADPPPPRVPDELPSGYRTGIITAITIFISFSLVLIKYWSLEAPGDWTKMSVLAAGFMVAAMLMQIVALWRALQVRDSLIVEYNRTLRWFMAAIVVMIAGLVLSVLASASQVTR